MKCPSCGSVDVEKSLFDHICNECGYYWEPSVNEIEEETKIVNSDYELDKALGK